MNLKVIASLLGVVVLTTGLLFLININKEPLDVQPKGPVKTEAYLRCEALVKDIAEESSCDKKWEKFEAEFKDCENYPPSEATETELESSTFRDVIFDMGDCYINAKMKDQALKVFERGLKFQDWMKDDHFNTYSAHFLLNREKQLLLPPQNSKCFNSIEFGSQIEKFVKIKDPNLIHDLMYADDTLDTQVMASDAGGYLSYNQWKDVFIEGQNSYNLKYDKKVGESCHITTGWDTDYPWRAFCGEKMGSKNCYYLTTIYAGIEATLGDFEEFKKKNP